jgi:hypothetical protein
LFLAHNESLFMPVKGGLDSVQAANL